MKRRISENQKVTLTLGQLKKLVRENSESGIDALYHEITHDPEFKKQMNKIGVQLASKVAEKAFLAKAYNEPERLNEPIEGIGEFVTQSIMAIAKRIIGRPPEEYRKLQLNPGEGCSDWLW